jgi:hypothetical protein
MTAGCVTTEVDKNTTTSQKETDSVVTRMRQYLANGKEKIDYGSISEGIKQLVSVLAEKDSLKQPSDEALDLAREAETELTKLKAALTIESEPSAWMDKSLNQKSGSTLDMSPQPSVLLTIDTGLGRSIVSNVPVLFRFTKGSGVLSGIVNTNDYGQADCKIVRFDNPRQENIIRASIVFKEKSLYYEFEGLAREFVYVPPTRTATIVVLEKSQLGLSSDPVITDAVFNSLKSVDFQFALYNGSFKGDEFEKVFGGDKDSIARMGLSEGVSYLVAVFSECYNVSQLELDGKKYNMYISEARATTRVIRVADGKVVYDAKIERDKAHSKHGQGSSVDKAIRNVLSLATEDMTAKLKADFAEIDKALTGNSK